MGPLRHKHDIWRLCGAMLVGLCVAFGAAQSARAADLNVYAAASLGGALDDIAEAWSAQTGGDLTLVFAGSSALARQIQAGAPADLVILANPSWMDVLGESELLRPDGRVDLLSNRLVLIGGWHERHEIDLDDRTALSERLGQARLALALTEAVPAGLYAREALEALGLWDTIADRVVETDNVRAALALVAVRAAAFGVVYATDAAAEPRVAVVAEIPPETHAPIRYPAAVLVGPRETEAMALLTFLQSPIAAAIFAGHGFGFLAEP